jgi:tetratricopeptide (TPR) repeat protein
MRAIYISLIALNLTACQHLADYSWPNSSAPIKANKPQMINKPISKPSSTIKPQPVIAPIEKTEPKEDVSVITPTITKPVLPPPVLVQANKKLADGRDMPAVQGLLATANDHLRAGKLEEAASSLERAQRLAPQSATVYQRLAEVRLQQGRTIEAEQLARKGLSYAQGNAQQAALWYLVAEAAERQGKQDAAIQAKNKAMQLEMAGDRG